MDMSQHPTPDTSTENHSKTAEDRQAAVFLGVIAVFIAALVLSGYTFGIAGVVLPMIGMTALGYVMMVLLTKG